MHINFTLGLLMGDGSFQINHWKKKYNQYRICIKLKNKTDNILMLKKIRNHHEGIGTLIVRKNYVLWAINHKKDLKWFLNEILDNKFLNLKPLMKEKGLKMIYCINNNISYSEYRYLIEKEKKGEWLWPFNKPKKTKVIFDEGWNHWLAGFSEAESCFCVRLNGNQSYSISQKDDLIIIESIKEFFDLPNKILKKKCGTYVLETYNVKCCVNIINFFDKYKLLGDKLNSFHVFKKHVLSKQQS